MIGGDPVSWQAGIDRFFYCPDYAEDVKSCIVSSPDVKREHRVTA